MADFKHADFWVAVATIAPVVFLANCVVATQMLQSRRSSSVLRAYAFSALAALICVEDALSALLSLLDRDDWVVVGTNRLAAYGLIVAMLVTFLAALEAGVVGDEPEAPVPITPAPHRPRPGPRP